MPDTPRIDAVVVGASAGGIEALERLLAAMPRAFPVPVLVVVHVSPTGISVLPQILSRAGPLRARHGRHGDALVPGRVYVAPPDNHLLASEEGVALSRGPRENGHRPAVDVLFRSAARTFGERVAAVVLSGSLDDGAAGLAVVKRAGGIAVVQDPADAVHPGMPLSALDRVEADHVVAAPAIAGVLAGLAGHPPAAGAVPDVPAGARAAAAVGRGARVPLEDDPVVREGHEYSCPDCGGVLRPEPDEGVHRCRVGHAWAANSLLAAQSGKIEEALWVVLRTLEEKVALARTMAGSARLSSHVISADRFDAQASRLEELSRTVREVLEAGAEAAALDDVAAVPDVAAPEEGGGADAGEPAEAQAG